MRKLQISFILTAALTLASPVTYTTLASWNAAGPASSATVDFDSLYLGGSQTQYASFVLSGVTFSGMNGNLVVYQSGYQYSDLGNGPSLTSSPLPGAIVINLPANTFGFGFLVGSGAAVPVNVTIDGGTTFQITNPTNPPANIGNPAQFWGVRNTVAMGSLTIATNTTSYRVVIDNFAIAGDPGTGGTGEVPEVSSGLLIGAGLLLLPLLRRKFQGSSL